MRKILGAASAGLLLALAVSGCSSTSALEPLAFAEPTKRTVPAGAYLAGASPGAAMGGNLHTFHSN